MAITTGTVIFYEGLGNVRFVVRPTSRKVSAKWKDGIVVSNIPSGMTRRDIDPIIAQLAPRLIAGRSIFRFDEQSGIEIEGWKVRFLRTATADSRMSATYSDKECTISIPQSADFDDERFTLRANGLICKVAANIAPKILIPIALEVSDRLGVAPTSWKVSHGHRTLGFCTPRHEIALSYMVMFLPRELREYIICHELAHLSEMNHSDRFHRLCNLYCRGREKELVSALKHYHWPVIR